MVGREVGGLGSMVSGFGFQVEGAPTGLSFRVSGSGLSGAGVERTHLPWACVDSHVGQTPRTKRHTLPCKARVGMFNICAECPIYVQNIYEQNQCRRCVHKKRVKLVAVPWFRTKPFAEGNPDSLYAEYPPRTIQ